LEQNKEPKLLTPDTISVLKMWLGYRHEHSRGTDGAPPYTPYLGLRAASRQAGEGSGKKRGEDGREKKLDHPQQQFWDPPLHLH